MKRMAMLVASNVAIPVSTPLGMDFMGFEGGEGGEEEGEK